MRYECVTAASVQGTVTRAWHEWDVLTGQCLRSAHVHWAATAPTSPVDRYPPSTTTTRKCHYNDNNNDDWRCHYMVSVVSEQNQHCGGKASSKSEGLSRGGVLGEGAVSQPDSDLRRSSQLLQTSFLKTLWYCIHYVWYSFSVIKQFIIYPDCVSRDCCLCRVLSDWWLWCAAAAVSTHSRVNWPSHVPSCSHSLTRSLSVSPAPSSQRQPSCSDKLSVTQICRLLIQLLVYSFVYLCTG